MMHDTDSDSWQQEFLSDSRQHVDQKAKDSEFK